MTAAHALQPQGPDKHEPKHAAVKPHRVSSFLSQHHLPNRTSLQALTVPVSSRVTKDGRAARKAIKAMDAATAARKAVRPLPTNPKPTTSKPVAKLSTVLEDTGKASFSVDKAGEVTKNMLRRTANGYSTVAERTGSTLAEAYEPNWFVALFETEAQRSRRINVQAVAQVLILTASVAGKVAARKAK